MVVRFGQAVIGPPGAGKTTYCHGLARFLLARGRPVAVINLDPANDQVPYPVAVDVRDLVNLTVCLGVCVCVCVCVHVHVEEMLLLLP